ncbi:clustered mitochondria-domain-containing protein [Mycotypha africana]|uniref:clustered mitochondria-domain-containing protein n=1 Tax=Mycotypha africana TaxID=64632 RepID=UPI0023016830|nr:clustered mitochondria-domain-containing protein [Mycotypha africana]KAI8987473.1 clustered mitochondria-domain-containing protein [Mycotypha africana]
MSTAPDEGMTTEAGEQISQEAVEEVYNLIIKLPRNIDDIRLTLNPAESVQDIKQIIMESPETCAYSCFYLSHNGKRLNDFVELKDVEGLTTETELYLVEDTYSERDVRVHISRLRDLLAGPYKPNPSSIGIDPAISFLTAVTGEIDEAITTDSNDKSVDDPFSKEPPPEHAYTNITDLDAPSQLADFVPKDFRRVAPECLKSLSLSGWNPVPHRQKLQGDLLYLVVTTLENETLHLTASTKGFFVNNCSQTKYDPSPKNNGAGKYSAHSLIHLLQQLSPLFAKKFSELQNFITRHHMLEVLPVSTYLPDYPWAVEQPEHLFDPSRPCETYLTAGLDSVEGLRDWNDELQSHRELPKSTMQERILRERLVNKVQSEFTEAAIRGAMAVVDGSVIPLNPLDPEESHMYVHNNIFFSKGNDGRNTFDELGGDEAAHVATGKDLEGVKIINTIEPENLYTLGSVIVDYKGARIVAQSIVPGIFRRQDENSIIYGSVDNGIQISSDETFHENIGKDIAKSLHLAEHTVINKEGDKEVQLFTSQETKGLIGADNRRYILDLYRLNPVDIEFQESECVAKDDKPAYPHKLTLLRHELMSLFWEHKFRKWLKEKTDQIRKEREASKSPEIEGGKENEEVTGDKKDAVDNAAVIEKKEEVEEVNEEDEIKIDINEFKLQFNADVFTTARLPDNDQTKQEQEVVWEASKFLRDEVIPSLVLDFVSYAISPLDGDALTKAMHRRGINMRYLGKLAELVFTSKEKRIDHIYKLIVQEMIVRASKRLLRNYLVKCSTEEVSLCISHFLNCLLGSNFNSKPNPVLPEGSNRNDFAWAQITPAGLKKLITQQVFMRFRYQLEDNAFEQLRFIPTLRDLCKRIGIQVAAYNYRTEAYTEDEKAAFAAEDAARQAAIDRAKQKMSSRKSSKKHQPETQRPVRRTTTFTPDDIYNIMPTVKTATTRSIFAEETFEAGKMSIAQGHKELGLELLLESLTLHEQTYGFLHPETSKCYAALAMIYHNNEEHEASLELQRKAIIASERTNGVDDPETIHHYLNLGLFEHTAGRTKLALKYIRHAFYYWNLLVGPNHPESATADNNVGVMLQTIRDYAKSTKFFERATKTHEAVFGKDHVLTATGYHILAKAYTLEAKFKEAAEAEKIAFEVFNEKLGPEDARTKDSQLWLRELTANANMLAQQKAIEELNVKNGGSKILPQQLANGAPATVKHPEMLTAAAAAKASSSTIPQKQHQTHDASSAAATNEDSKEPSKGHLPIDELLEFINGEEQGKKSNKKPKKLAHKKQRK